LPSPSGGAVSALESRLDLIRAARWYNPALVASTPSILSLNPSIFIGLGFVPFTQINHWIDALDAQMWFRDLYFDYFHKSRRGYFLVGIITISRDSILYFFRLKTILQPM
jgi:hypothetical protein